MKVPLFLSIMLDTTRTIFQVIGDAMAVSVALFALDTFRQEQNNEGLLSEVSIIRQGPICNRFFLSHYLLETSMSGRTLRVCLIGEENRPIAMMSLRKKRGCVRSIFTLLPSTHSSLQLCSFAVDNV